MVDTVPRRYSNWALYPNAAQAAALENYRVLLCRLYNAVVQVYCDNARRERAAKPKWTGEKWHWPSGRYEISRELKTIRADDPEYAALHSSALENTVLRAEQAYAKYCENLRTWSSRMTAARTAGRPIPDFPREPYRSIRDYPGIGLRDAPKGFQIEVREKGYSRIRIKGVPGWIRMRGRFPPGVTKHTGATLTLAQGRWTASFSVAIEKRRTCGNQTGEVRLDLVDRFAVVKTVDGGLAAGPEEAVFFTSDGRIISQIQGDTSTSGAATPDLQAAQARCKRGSNRYRKLGRMIARKKAKEARQRKEALHRWTTDLTRRFAECVVFGPLQIADLVVSGRGNAQDWGAAVETKATLNRRLLDQCPAAALTMLEYKAEEAGCNMKIVRADSPAQVGNELVTAAKAARKAKRAVRRQIKQQTEGTATHV